MYPLVALSASRASLSRFFASDLVLRVSSVFDSVLIGLAAAVVVPAREAMKSSTFESALRQISSLTS